MSLSTLIAEKAKPYLEDHIPRLSIARKIFRLKPLDDDEKFLVDAVPNSELSKQEGIYHPIMGYPPELDPPQPVKIEQNADMQVEGGMFCIEHRLTMNDRLGPFYITEERVLQACKLSMAAFRAQEDKYALSLCRKAMELNLICKEVSRTLLLDLFYPIEKRGLKVSHVVVAPKWIRDIRLHCPTDYHDSSKEEYMKSGARGTLWGAEVYATTQQPDDYLLVTAAPLLGEMGIRKTGFKTVANSLPDDIKEGALVSEQVGWIVNNPEAAIGATVISTQKSTVFD